MLRVRIATALILLFLAVTFGGCVRSTPDGTPDSPTYTPTASQVHTPTDSSAAIETVLGYAEGCAPPCWHGIIPGISTEEDVVRILEQLDAEDVLSYPGPPEDGTVHVVGLSIGLARITTDGERVEYIWGDSPASYRVKHVIGRLGEPEAVAPRDAMPGMEGVSPYCEDLDFPEGDPTGSFFLMYPSKGTTYVVTRYYYGYVCPGMQVVQFLYYEPTSLEEALNEHGSPAFGKRDFDGVDIVEWHGYGDGY